MASSSRSQVLSLYKTMLRESGRFSSYNYRSYAIRRIKDAFREKKNVHDSHEIQSLVQRAKENLEVIKRQTHPPYENSCNAERIEAFLPR
uniref:Complex 1 LYR protein domain-containing protein n=1 Tax=Leptobrachium leishanense TaxID=445787 RepID=A0A8C5MD91_9ANUR